MPSTPSNNNNTDTNQLTQLVPSVISSQSELDQVIAKIKSKSSDLLSAANEDIRNQSNELTNAFNTIPKTPAIPGISHAPNIGTDSVKKYLPDPTELIAAKLPFFASNLASFKSIVSTAQNQVKQVTDAAKKIKEIPEQAAQAESQAREAFNKAQSTNPSQGYTR